MTSLFINLSNHPVTEWSEAQKVAAMEFGEQVDIPFPEIDATCGADVIKALADEYVLKIRHLASPSNATVHIMGEQTFTYSMLYRLQKMGYKCIASTTKRLVEHDDENRKIITFCFERFREYEKITW